MVLSEPQDQTEEFNFPQHHFDLMMRDTTCRSSSSLLLFKPSRQPKWEKINQEVGRDQLARFVGEPDIYLTPNSFHGWRLVRLLSNLNAFYLDFDIRKQRIQAEDVMRLAAQLMDQFERLGWPTPNALIYTGRGLHVYWLIDSVPAQALPRWQSAMRHMVQVTGADPAVTDCTRNMRVIGTVNSKTGTKVTAEVLHRQRYNFGWFCDQVFPHTRAEIRDLSAARARNKKNAGNPNRNTKGSIYERWRRVYSDLITISDHFWFGGVPEGHRNHILFHMANALSWFTVSDALENEIIATARTYTPTLTKAEAKSYTSTVVRRAKASATGKETRYKYKRETLWREFEPLVGKEPDLVEKLRAIIPDDLAQQREKERQAKRDRAIEGRYKQSKEQYNQVRAESKADKAAQARQLKAEGLSQRKIAAKLGLSQSQVQRLLKSDPRSAPLV